MNSKPTAIITPCQVSHYFPKTTRSVGHEKQSFMWFKNYQETNATIKRKMPLLNYQDMHENFLWQKHIET